MDLVRIQGAAISNGHLFRNDGVHCIIKVGFSTSSPVSGSCQSLLCGLSSVKRGDVELAI